MRNLFVAIVLGISNFMFYMCFPMPGYRRWDALMTASSIKHFSIVPWKVHLYFAHTAVIPLTKLFDLLIPGGDPLMITALRESFFSALNTAIIYLFLCYLLKKDLPAFLLATAYMFCQAHWTLASGGEEKDLTLFVSTIYLIGFLQFKGWIDLKIKFLSNINLASENHKKFFLRQRLWEFILGIILAISVMIHLQNVLLLPTTLFIYMLRRETWRSFRTQFMELFFIFGTAGIILIGWFGFIIVGLNHITSLKEGIGWFLQYHSSDSPYFGISSESLGYQFGYAYWGFRRYLFGDSIPPEILANFIPSSLFLRYLSGDSVGAKCLTIEAIILAIIMIFVAKRAYRYSPKIVGVALVYLFCMGAHFFFYIPEDAEQWGGAVFCGLVVIGAGVFADNRKSLTILVAIFVLILAVINIHYYNKEAEKYSNISKINRIYNEHASKGFNGFFLRNIPLPNLVQYISSIIEPNSIIFVPHHHFINHFINYTNIEAIYAPYLNFDKDFVQGKVKWPIMRIYYYRPRMTIKDIEKRIKSGQKVYKLTQDLYIDPQYERFITRIDFEGYSIRQIISTE